ncbi:MAG: YeeE/YedE family protein [Gammaproteobacteria bacterium]|nr:YeeE/YedE family protein [Gammaproteobacteria bacterium]
MAILDKILVGGFILAFILGAVATRTNFCTMGAVSDWVNMGDKNRFRSWVLAIAVAILGVTLAAYAGLVDMGLTTSNDTANPPYRVASFVWLRYIVGGLIFGIGMTLGSGCGNKTLLRLGGGNLKSVFVLLAISAGASLMIFTNFDYNLFLQWMTPLAIDFAKMGASGQDIGSVVNALSGVADSETLNLVFGLAIAALMMIWVFKSADFRASGELILAGLVVGLVVAGGWYLTAGSLGQTLLDEAEFMDVRPYALGAQSFTFVAPTAHAYQYLTQNLSSEFLTFALVAALGVIAGAFVYSLLFRKFRFEWFNSFRDFLNHIIGGFLMGIGGVLAMGCTVGQAITGAATLALGSFVAFGSIVLGSALTMKYQYYKMLYEDASVADVLLTALAEVHLLPGGMRRLEAM